MKLEWRKGLCGICPAGCWVEVGLNNGILADIRLDASHALGAICSRGQHATEIVYSENRLKYAMKRPGHKGSPALARINVAVAHATDRDNLHRVK